MAPAQVLPDEGDGHGCLVWVQLRHVKIIHKVDKLFSTGWPIVDASLHKPRTSCWQSWDMKLCRTPKCRHALSRQLRVNMVGSGAVVLLTFFSRGDSRIFWNDMTSVK